jgi:2,5-diketo-D-gluconate reductase A
VPLKDRTTTLNDGVEMPVIGYGVWQILPESTTTARVLDALAAGYRLVDTAASYGNERGVGDAVREFGRDRVFVTSKLWNPHHGRDATLRAFDATLAALGFDTLDLYLVHWPVPGRGLYAETWQTLVELRDSGRVRSVGVSNFHPEHLDRLEASGVVPSVNQVELHPFLQQRDLRDDLRRRGIFAQAWSPLGAGALLQDPAVGEVAAELGVSPAQVVLRWLLDEGVRVLPRSGDPGRIAQNVDLDDVRLEPHHVEVLRGLDRGLRTGPHPDAFTG